VISNHLGTRTPNAVLRLYGSSSAPITDWITIDYNNYFYNPVSGNTLAIIQKEGTTFRPANLIELQAATEQDFNSLNIDPLFASPGGPAPEDYMPSANMPGLPGLAGIMDDFGNVDVRNAIDPVTMGAWENECNVVVTTQPGDIEVCENDEATFSIEATGNGSAAYQWQISTDGGLSWTDIVAPAYPNPPYADATTPTLTINPVVVLEMNNNQYRCRISYTEGSNQPCVAYSNAALIEVTAAPTTSAIYHQ
jgi:hypothetical protein